MKPLAFALVALAATSPALAASGSSALKSARVHDAVVDEHDTNGFYAQDGFCTGQVPDMGPAALAGDAANAGTGTTWDVSPWTGVASEAVGSSTYTAGADCGTNCLRLQLSSGAKTLVFDTRGTAGRSFALDFTARCGLAEGCQGPAGDPAVFGGALSTPALLNVFLSVPYTQMAVCSSTACLEAEPAFAKLWFADPSAADVTWRVDWTFLRVLRVSATEWYVVADACDGSQVAGLSKLIGNRTRPKTVFNGHYKLPLFIAVTR